MTSEEIKTYPPFEGTEEKWLREIAYQLAVGNEQRRVDLYKNLADSLGSSAAGERDTGGQRGVICPRGHHQFDGPIRNDSKCLNCGWTSGQIFTWQHDENVASTERSEPSPHSPSSKPSTEDKCPKGSNG